MPVAASVRMRGPASLSTAWPDAGTINAGTMKKASTTVDALIVFWTILLPVRRHIDTDRRNIDVERAATPAIVVEEHQIAHNQQY